jgi:hypothetical protein
MKPIIARGVNGENRKFQISLNRRILLKIDEIQQKHTTSMRTTAGNNSHHQSW